MADSRKGGNTGNLRRRWYTWRMKYSQWIGIGAALLLIVACYLPWAYFPDLQKEFTGFFSENNAYGRPGKIFIFLCGITIILFLIPRVWAKRVNIFAGALVLAFAIKCFILYSACYRGICPEKRIGLFLILVASVLMIGAAVSPNTRLKDETP